MSSASVSIQPATARIPLHVLVFAMAGNRFALPLASIEKVLPAVEITPWPHLPSFVAGVIDVRGQVLPVVCASELLHQGNEMVGTALVTAPHRLHPHISDHFIVLHIQELRIVLWVERALEVALVSDQQNVQTAYSRAERWSPLRINDELTLLWNSAHLFDAQQTQVLQSLFTTLGAKPEEEVAL